jgi:hypothetical protein
MPTMIHNAVNSWHSQRSSKNDSDGDSTKKLPAILQADLPMP